MFHCNFVTICVFIMKYAYSKILKILKPKKEKFQIKKSDIFHIPVQNMVCGYSLDPPRRGGFNEYPQYMYFSKLRKIMYIRKPQFYYM